MQPPEGPRRDSAPIVFHTSSPFAKKAHKGLFDQVEEAKGVKNEDHRLSSKLAYLRALQTLKLTELEKIEQLLYARSSSASQLESKLIDLERSRIAMVSKSKDLMHDREGKEASRQGLYLKHEEFQQRTQACQAQAEGVSHQLTEVHSCQASLDHEIADLQEEQSKILQRLQDIDALLDANSGTVEQKESNSKALHSKLKDVKRHLLMVRSETIASREQDARKGLKSDLTLRQELKQEQLEEKEKELLAQLRLEHADVKELKARLTQKRQDRQGLLDRLEGLRPALADMLDKRAAAKQLLAKLEAKRSDLENSCLDLQASSREATKILQKLEIRLAELETSSVEIKDHLQEMAQQKLVFHQRLQIVQLASQQLQLNSDALHAEVQALVARIEKTQRKLFRVQGEPLFVRQVTLMLSPTESISGSLTITQSLVIFSPAVESLREGHLYRLCGEITEVIEVDLTIEDNQDVLEIRFIKDLCILHASRTPCSPTLMDRFVSSSLTSVFSDPLSMLPPPALSFHTSPTLAPLSLSDLPDQLSTQQSDQTSDLPSLPVDNAPSIRKVRFRERDLKLLGEELRSRLPEIKAPLLPDFDLIGKSELLSDAQIRNIVAFAPHRFGISSWRLAYSLTRDGRSLTEFYAAQEGALACLILARDSDRVVFGGFTPVAWRKRSGHYGSGESFVFKVGEEIIPHRWSGVNCFFMLSNNCNFAMGGGEHFAFSIESNMRNGASGPCSTYNSPQLSSQPLFSLDYLEAWVPDPEFVSNSHHFRD